MKKLAIAIFINAVWPVMAAAAEDGFKAPEVEGVNIPWKAIGIIFATFICIVALTLKNPRRTQTEITTQ